MVVPRNKCPLLVARSVSCLTNDGEVNAGNRRDLLQPNEIEQSQVKCLETYDEKH